MNRCPTTADLAKYVAELLPAAEAAAAEAHVENCPACVTQMARLARTPLPKGDRDQVRAVLTGRPPPLVHGIELLEVIGRGATGDVWKARQSDLGRLVAVKTLLLNADSDVLRAEAAALATLDHPNVVRVFQSGATADGYFFAMEYLPAGSLTDDRLRSGAAWTPPAAARLVRDAARAVQAAHDAKILHRDIKPGNILLAADRTPKVADFGLAATFGLRAGTGPAGTPCYMAPEQAADGPLDVRTDVYGLGTVLYEVLVDRPPVSPDGDVPAVLARVRTDDPIAPRLLRPSVPVDLETICLKCLQKDPAGRYPSARDLADDLDRFLEGRPVVARPVSRARRLVRGARREPVLSGLVAALVAVIATAMSGTIVLWRKAEAEATRARAAAALADSRRKETLDALSSYADAIKKLYDSRVALTPDELERYDRASHTVLRLLEDSGDDPATEQRTAWAALRIAHTLQARGDYAGAATMVARIEPVYARLAAVTDDRRLKNEAIQAVAQYAVHLHSLGRLTDAEPRYAAAVTAAAALSAQHPDSDLIRTTLVSTRWHYGQFLSLRNRFAEAEPLYAAARPDAAALLAKFPIDSARYIECSAVAHGSAAVALHRYGAVDAAERFFRDWLDELDRLRTVLPDCYRYYDPVLDYRQLARIQCRAGRTADAERTLVRASGVLRAALDADPSLDAARLSLATVLADLGAVRWPADPAGAAAPHREALALFRRLYREADSKPRVIQLAYFLADCADPAVRDPAEAVRLAETAYRLYPADRGVQELLIRALASAGRHREAVALGERHPPTFVPDCLTVHLVLAESRWRLGDRTAVAAFDRVHDTMENDWSTPWNLWARHDALWREMKGGDPPTRAVPRPRG